MLVPIRITRPKSFFYEPVYPGIDVWFGLGLDFGPRPLQPDSNRVRCHTVYVPLEYGAGNRKVLARDCQGFNEIY